MMLRLLPLTLLLLSWQEGTISGSTRSRPLLLAADPVSAFDLPAADFAWTMKPIHARNGWKRQSLSFPSPVQTSVDVNNTVRAFYWTPTGHPGPRPAVIVLHWMGGSFTGLDLFCQRLCESGIVVLQPYMPHYGPRRSKDRALKQRFIEADFETTLANFRQAILDIRRCGDWLARRPEVVPWNIGVVGISMGAILGSLVAGIDPRFDSCVLMLGGGNLAQIVENDSKETAPLKERIRELGLSPEQAREMLRPCEPLTYAHRIAPGSVLMINARNDEVIPPDCSRQLQEAIGTGEIHWVEGGHHDLLFALGETLPRIVGHLTRPRTY